MLSLKDISVLKFSSDKNESKIENQFSGLLKEI